MTFERPLLSEPLPSGSPDGAGALEKTQVLTARDHNGVHHLSCPYVFPHDVLVIMYSQGDFISLPRHSFLHMARSDCLPRL